MKKFDSLKRIINDLEDEIRDNFQNINSWENSRNKIEFSFLKEEEIKGILVRNRIKWCNEGERARQYFWHLENRDFTNKHGQYHYFNRRSVDLGQTEFYASLYSTNKDYNGMGWAILDNIATPILDEATAYILDEPIIMDEIEMLNLPRSTIRASYRWLPYRSFHVCLERKNFRCIKDT